MRDGILDQEAKWGELYQLFQRYAKKQIYSGKLLAEKEKGKYKITPEMENMLEGLYEEKNQREKSRWLAEYIEETEGIKHKSAMRCIQRWRKQGLPLEEIARKFLGENWQEE